MAALELLALDEATPQIVAPQAGDTAKLPLTLNAATGDEVALDLGVTVNKATSGNYTGLKLNIVETAAPGTADLFFDFQKGGTTAMKFETEDLKRLLLTGTHAFECSFNGTTNRNVKLDAFGLNMYASFGLAWSSSATSHAIGLDTGLKRAAAGVLSVTNASTGGGALEFIESTAPAGLANSARIYAEDNGSGKTRLMAIFGTGAAVQIAIEP